MRKLHFLLVTTLLAVTSYAADPPSHQLKGFFDRPIGVRVHEFPGMDHKAIRDQVVQLLVKAGAEMYLKGPYDHNFFISPEPIHANGEVIGYFITAMPCRKVEYTNPDGEKLTWWAACLDWQTAYVEKDKLHEGIETVFNRFLKRYRSGNPKK